MAGTRNSEPPRSTAYYYADLEKIKRQNGGYQDGGYQDDGYQQDGAFKQNGVPQNNRHPQENYIQNIQNRQNELSEYVESNEVVNDGGTKDIPPLRDRWSPEYSTPENGVKVETYSTAGTFPMPEPKEKEPLLAELEIVGRVPLTQLESGQTVRRSRSWYLCCPDIGEEEACRQSSWRYSSLRPVTAPPAPRNGDDQVATHSSGRVDDVATLRAERDALARALAAERQRAASAARAHDARLAELHGVIAELVRRRAADKLTKTIPEEEVSDECESTTQPAGELDIDPDVSRTEQNDNSSLLSPTELPTPQDPKLDPLPEDTDVSTTEHIRAEHPKLEVSPPQGSEQCSSLQLSERDSEICVSTARCCQYARGGAEGGGSCDRDRGSPALMPVSPGRCEAREAKLASRVRLRRTEDTESNQISDDEAWCVEAAERLALDVCSQAGLREALVAASNGDESVQSAAAAVWRARCLRLAADCRVLDCALAQAVDTAHRLSCACAVQESSSVALCGALRAADRALETYDVLLALAETQTAAPRSDSEYQDHITAKSTLNVNKLFQRAAAEAVACRLLRRLEAAPSWGEALLSPGPWHNHHQNNEGDKEVEPWSSECEARLRAHAARLKRDTVALRELRPPPTFYSPHDMEEADSRCSDSVSMEEMEAAVMMQEMLVAKEALAMDRAAALLKERTKPRHGENECTRRRHRERHWLDTPASETDL
ncbi:uncharacterized protein LOC112048778 [Bicyclus anynana]|uniref:Uncharacterized protein LOC112048778 n=1 Tax=Bicyclus anynana TaxID=110368 RepID=A0ABM3M4R4_BICAN|nr:uncharacterized protein LOC112048778 [Bicyclus anynana]